MTPTDPAPLSRSNAPDAGEFGKSWTLGHRLLNFGLGRLSLPPRAWTRLVVLFFGLAAIKLSLLFSLGKHLFEIHWRVENFPETARGDFAAFGVFIGLGILTLLRFGRYCEKAGRASSRVANLTVVGLGLVFIFLTLHNGTNNYLFPVLSGTLRWTSLVSYFCNALFFNAPYLAAWLCAYGLGYYVLVRSGQESKGLYLTGAFAAAYSPFFLQDLAIFHNELWVLDCLGAVSLMACWNPVRKISAAWLLLPLGWLLLGSGQLFWLAPAELGWPLKYFMGLVGGTLVAFAATTFLAAKYNFSAAWSRLAIFYAAAFLLLANTYYPVAPNFTHALCAGFELPRYFLGESLLCLILAMVVSIIGRRWPKPPLWWFDVLAIFLLALAFVDLRLSQLLGVRLEWDLMALGNNPKMMWRMASPYLPAVLAWVGLLSLIYAGTLSLASRREQKTLGRSMPPSGFSAGLCYCTAVFLFLGILGAFVANPDKGRGQVVVRLAQTSPLWKGVANKTLTAEEFRRSTTRLGVGELAAKVTNLPSRQRRELNVVLIFMESSYNKHLSLFGGAQETQPLLSQYRDRMELFPNFFSSFPSSIHARFASFTSLYPVRDFNAFTLRRVGVKSLFENFHEQGYSCSLFYSSFLDFTGFREFLANRGIDELYDADTMPGQRKTEPVSWGLREEETLGAMRAQLKKYARNHQRFFLTYVPAAPHYPYEKVSEKFHKFKPSKFGDFTPLYLNELLYMDWVMASLLDELKESQLLDKTLVVITDDHGEMLGADGGPIGHGWALTPELANAPLIIMDPQKPGYRVNNVIGSQVDLLPTLLDRLGMRAPTDQLYEGLSLDGPVPTNRMIYLNSYQQYGVIVGKQVFFGDREKLERAGDLQCSFIANEGSKTMFMPVTPSQKPEISIQDFDKFQENLLQNYSTYRARFCRAPSPWDRPLASAP